MAAMPERGDRSEWSMPVPGEFHTWTVPVRERADWPDLLSKEERRRLDGLVVREARDTFVTSRAAQRLIGARYLGRPPTAVTISRECGYCGAGHGRPRFDGAAIDYSVSHTRDWVLVAVAGAGLVGVDIESPDSCRDTEGLAGVTLTARERERFDALLRAERDGWFLSAWTRKEAAMKLTGLGLAAPPGRLDVIGPILSAGAVPRWPATPIHLYNLAAPGGHASALASTVPLTVLRTFVLPETFPSGAAQAPEQVTGS
jgi:4'-phosphopantetheinyl transferase